MSEGRDPSAQQPSSGSPRFPDPFAPGSPSSADGTALPPGQRDLPWKATAERRDLWGPRQQALEGTVRPPTGSAVGPVHRSWLVRLGSPVVAGGLAALATVVVVLGTGLGGPLLALAAAAGIGILALGGTGIAVNRPIGTVQERHVLDASVLSSTREVLERILEADAATRDKLAPLRPQASSTPAAALVLEDVDSLLTRIDALVGTEALQALRPSAGEVTMLEGIACRYVPELVDAAEDTIGFLRTFAGTARRDALANLESVRAQLSVLAEGVERIEGDLVGGVSRDLEVHAEFLRARFADQHLNPIIDV